MSRRHLGLRVLGSDLLFLLGLCLFNSLSIYLLGFLFGVVESNLALHWEELIYIHLEVNLTVKTMGLSVFLLPEYKALRYAGLL
jgi:hypothetical protein